MPDQDVETIPFRGIYNDPKAYRALDVDAKEIRYLSIAPGLDEDDLVCSLEYTCVESDVRVRYEALSYTWGDLRETDEISLQYPSGEANTERQFLKQYFKITRNLHSALRALRFEHRSRTVWVDAVCINQMDPSERTQQVALMGHVYSFASKVLVWLGDADLFTVMAVNVIRTFEKLKQARISLRNNQRHEEIANVLYGIEEGYQAFCGPENEIDAPQMKMKEHLEHDPGFGIILALACMGDLETYQQLCRAMSLMDLHWAQMHWSQRLRTVQWIIIQSANELVARPWFKRIWVVQEVFRAARDSMNHNRVVMHIGKTRFYWPELCAFHRSFKQHLEAIAWTNLGYLQWVTPNETSDLDFFYSKWQKMWYLRCANSDLLIFELLTLTSGFEASDYRDKLYAMMLLAQDTQEILTQNVLLRPDYAKSEVKVLGDFVRWHIESTETLDILSLISPVALVPAPRSYGKPTWVPDLFSPCDEWPFADILFRNYLAVPELYGFLKGDEHNSLLLPLEFDASSIFVNGVILSRIREVQPGSMRYEESSKRLLIEIDGRSLDLFRFLWEKYWDPWKERSDADFFRKCLHMFGCVNENIGSVVLSGFAAYIRGCSIPVYDQENWIDFERERDDDSDVAFCRMISRRCQHRRIFVSEDGSLGLCPESAQQQDIVAALQTGKFPFILRPVTGNKYTMLGPCLFYDKKWILGDAEVYMQKNHIGLDLVELL